MGAQNILKAAQTRFIERDFTFSADEKVLIDYALRQPGACFLDSCGLGKGASSLRFGPSKVFTLTQAGATLREVGEVEHIKEAPLDALDQLIAQTRESHAHLSEKPNFAGPGWSVFASYDLNTLLCPAKLKETQHQGPDFPLLYAAFYEWALVRNTGGKWRLQVLEDGTAERADEVSRRLQLGLSTHKVAQHLLMLDALELVWSKEQYADAFQKVQSAIYEGDIYQANLTQRFVAQGKVDPVTLYQKLREVSPAPYACYLDCGDGRVILSSSPECFYSVRDGKIETRPIKGTRPVQGDLAADENVKRELLASEKDRAELVMIVDLERNDLGRICEVGSIEVPELCRAESFEQVHHLVSTVRGKLCKDMKFSDFLHAGFPGGSITGAPKIRAMQILREIEPHCRGPYTGSVFALGLDGSLESNILIRTILVEPQSVSFNVGGGIVADSQCDAEYQECLDKARGMLAALGDPASI